MFVLRFRVNFVLFVFSIILSYISTLIRFSKCSLSIL
jgi:hypothetical protein